MIKWGMIGAGDVTEVKSGPAFKKVRDSDMIAVMRRDVEKVKDYALRHQIANWYEDADELLANSDINAVYIATPPNVHLDYVKRSLSAGKMVYVEKPVAMSVTEAQQMKELVEASSSKLVVAHYRRANPYFLKIKELIKEGVIGTPSLVSLQLFKKDLSVTERSQPKVQWRLDPAISGGGLFYDLAPHQIDLMIDWFGDPIVYGGLADLEEYTAVENKVAGQILFSNQVMFTGIWDFKHTEDVDKCIIYGNEGYIEFSFFENKPIQLYRGGDCLAFKFESLAHVQQPMIEEVVQYFEGHRDNPCSIDQGIRCMQIMEAFTKR